MTVHTRRAALAALATAAAATPLLLIASKALAQTAPAAPTDPAAYADYVTQTLTIGGTSLQASQIAADKAQDPMVKEFAGLEVGEQTAVATVLSSTGATPPALPDDAKAKVQSLQDAAAGPEFDAAYVDAQIEGHQQLLAVQQTISGSMDATVEVITAKLVEQGINSHLAMLNHIKEQLGGAGAAAPAQQPAATETPTTPAEPTATTTTTTTTPAEPAAAPTTTTAPAAETTPATPTPPAETTTTTTQ